MKYGIDEYRKQRDSEAKLKRGCILITAGIIGFITGLIIILLL